MNSPQLVYEQLKEVRQRKVAKMVKPATIIEPQYSVAKTVGIMVNKDSYDVFCMNGKNVLTTNARELLGSRDIQNMCVLPLLHKIVPISKESTVEKAASIMSHYRTRAVPVVEDGELLGVVKIEEIIQLLSQQNLRWIPASNILTSNPITVSGTESLAMARRIMMTKRIDHLPIIQSGKISHVLTTMHLLQLVKPEERIGRGLRGLNLERRFKSQIGNVGSSRIPNCLTSASLNTVMESMLRNDASCCLLTLWDNLHGIITYKDLLGILESKIPNEVPLFIVGLPQNIDNAGIIKEKFDKIIRNLRKVYPEVEEAKATIKTIHSPTSNRQHFEVTVRVFTPYTIHNYTEQGWELSKIFDIIGGKVIRNLTKRRKNRWKTSIRRIDKKEIF
ncbi:MAG TPA: CBS domain-containing protein [Candidatus Bathyarchaeia archaeon]|nr:CBS domain-containing protein [Candidatus Bathyarchaeia archaeon]